MFERLSLGRLGRVRARDNRQLWVFCDGGLRAAEVHQLGAEPELGFALVGGRAKAVRGVKIGAGCGALVRSQQGDVLDWAWRSLPEMTNNEAEYAGLLLGIELARKRQPHETIFVMDSNIVVGQLCGRFAVHSRSLRRWHRQAEQGLAALGTVKFCAVPREWNPLADALARQAGIPWPQFQAALTERLEE